MTDTPSHGSTYIGHDEPVQDTSRHVVNGASVPHAVDTKPARTKSQGQEIALTDQTNLLPFRRVLAVFGGLSLCALVSCLDSTIVATALPSISAHFNAGSVSSWVPSSYLLTSTAFQPLCENFPRLAPSVLSYRVTQ